MQLNLSIEKKIVIDIFLTVIIFGNKTTNNVS